MKISHFLKFMFIVTAMGVLYIHLQMNIYDFAYRGKIKQQKIEQLAEVNGRVKNDILRLQSSDHIGRELLTKDTKYQFASRSHIVEVAADRPSWPDVIASGARTTGGFFSKIKSLTERTGRFENLSSSGACTRARLCSEPAAIATTLLNSPGTVLWPLPLSPQATTVAAAISRG